MRATQKLFGLTADEDHCLAALVQYTFKAGFITKLSLQEFMQFAIACADSVLKQHFERRKRTSGKRSRRWRPQAHRVKGSGL